MVLGKKDEIVPRIPTIDEAAEKTPRQKWRWATDFVRSIFRAFAKIN